jgi:NAD(P)H-nitrite reductase large subunit
MEKYKYLIVGAGMTADAAVRGIRELDPDGRIGMVGSDHNPPYNRPPLTKALWKGKPLESIWRRTQEFSADLHLGRTIRSIDPDKLLVQDDQGADYKLSSCWQPVVPHAGCLSAQRILSITAPWMITGACVS